MLQHDESISALSYIDTGTVDYYGVGPYTGLNPFFVNTYNNLQFDNGTYTLDGDLTVTGDLMVGTGSTLDCSNKTITISGSWTNNGTFSSGTGTVKFTGASQSNVSGDNNFYNFTCEVGGKVLQFEADKIQTITGLLTLKGASVANRLVLQSSTLPTQWKILPQGTVAVDFLDVHDSYNTGSAIYNANSIFNNCVGWGQNAPLPPTPPSNTATITAQLSILTVPFVMPPNISQMSDYQVSSFNPYMGPVYLYQPLTPYDMAAFDTTMFDASNLQFIDGSISFMGHDGLLPSST